MGLLFGDKIPKTLQSGDTIYHYCDINTAIEYILHNKQLRLSHRRNAVDPIESILPSFSFSRQLDEADGEFSDTSPEAFEIQKRALNKFNNAKQLSFCMNKPVDPVVGATELQKEYYGFLKPRMWDQYANKYKGVCLAFSLRALKRKGKDYLNGPVTYHNYDRLKANHKSINENRIERVGLEGYWQEFSKGIDQIMFTKHLDYESENEYKFVSFSENEYDYLDISGCLKAVLVSMPFTSEFMQQILAKYSKKFNAELLYIEWTSNGVNHTSLKEINELVDMVSNIIKRSKLSDDSEKQV